MTFFGWNKTGAKRFEVFVVSKPSAAAQSRIGETVATFRTQRECEADCLARNRAVAAKLGLGAPSHRSTTMTRTNPTKPYTVTVADGATVRTFARFGRWDADMKATEEKRNNPTATVTVRAAVTCRRCDQEMEDAESAFGCEDPTCPMARGGR